MQWVAVAIRLGRRTQARTLTYCYGLPQSSWKQEQGPFKTDVLSMESAFTSSRPPKIPRPHKSSTSTPTVRKIVAFQAHVRGFGQSLSRFFFGSPWMFSESRPPIPTCPWQNRCRGWRAWGVPRLPSASSCHPCSLSWGCKWLKVGLCIYNMQYFIYTQRVQVPNILGFWFHKPYPKWILEPGTSHVRYLVYVYTYLYIYIYADMPTTRPSPKSKHHVSFSQGCEYVWVEAMGLVAGAFFQPGGLCAVLRVVVKIIVSGSALFVFASHYLCLQACSGELRLPWGGDFILQGP